MLYCCSSVFIVGAKVHFPLMKRSHIFIIEPAFISHMLFACSSHSILISINRYADKRNVVLLLRVCVKSRWPKMVRSSWSYRTDETAPPSRCYLLCLCYWNYLWFWLGQVNTENNNNEHILSLIIMIWWNTKIEYMYSMRMHRFWHMHSKLRGRMERNSTIYTSYIPR